MYVYCCINAACTAAAPKRQPARRGYIGARDANARTHTHTHGMKRNQPIDSDACLDSDTCTESETRPGQRARRASRGCLSPALRAFVDQHIAHVRHDYGDGPVRCSAECVQRDEWRQLREHLPASCARLVRRVACDARQHRPLLGCANLCASACTEGECAPRGKRALRDWIARQTRAGVECGHAWKCALHVGQPGWYVPPLVGRRARDYTCCDNICEQHDWTGCRDAPLVCAPHNHMTQAVLLWHFGVRTEAHVRALDDDVATLVVSLMHYDGAPLRADITAVLAALPHGLCLRDV